jgi:hypothetical protein
VLGCCIGRLRCIFQWFDQHRQRNLDSSNECVLRHQMPTPHCQEQHLFFWNRSQFAVQHRCRCKMQDASQHTNTMPISTNTNATYKINFSFQVGDVLLNCTSVFLTMRSTTCSSQNASDSVDEKKLVAFKPLAASTVTSNRWPVICCCCCSDILFNLSTCVCGNTRHCVCGRLERVGWESKHNKPSQAKQ